MTPKIKGCPVHLANPEKDVPDVFDGWRRRLPRWPESPATAARPAAILRFLTRAGFLGLIPAHIPAASAAEGIATVLAAGVLASIPPLVHALSIRPARALRAL